MNNYLLRVVRCTSDVIERRDCACADDKAALEEAYRTAQHLVAEKVIAGDVIQADSVDVLDSCGDLVGSVQLQQVFRIG